MMELLLLQIMIILFLLPTKQKINIILFNLILKLWVENGVQLLDSIYLIKLWILKLMINIY